jgi:hypothetical protein
MTAMNSSIVIRPVRDKAGLRAFLDVPFAVFRDDPNWIAPLYLERFDHLNRKRNPFFRHAEVELFVALRGGKPVGRISAQINRLHLDRYHDATGHFGFLDAIDDGGVFAALAGAATDWLSGRGMQRMTGPFSLSINDETGLLIDGFNHPPRIMMGHARPWYAVHLDALGFAKVIDVLAYDHDGETPLPRPMQAMVDKAYASGDLSVRTLSKKNLHRDLSIIMEIFNDAWSENWGFVPMTQAEIDLLGKNLKMLVGEDYIAIASWKGEPCAMALTLPDINQWIKGLNGRLMLFGWMQILWHLLARPPQAVRMPLMGVKRKFHGHPLGATLALACIDHIRKAHLARGTRRAELSWILEDNWPMRRMLDALGARPYKTYRVYECKL